MTAILDGKKVAIIATDGFEQSELMDPLLALTESGASCDILAPTGGRIKGWSNGNWSGKSVSVTSTIAAVNPFDYDALFIPGGTLNCDRLRMDSGAIDFIKKFFDLQRPVGAICHGPQLLIEADLVKGRILTSYGAIQTDLENAGATWLDQEVVVDGVLVTSRSPHDLAAFISKLIDRIANGQSHRSSARQSNAPANLTSPEIPAMTPNEQRVQLLTQLNGFRSLMFMTVTTEGDLTVRPMAVVDAKTDGVLWFVSGKQSFQVNEIQRGVEVYLTGQSDYSSYVAAHGSATVHFDRATIEKFWSERMRVWFPSGPDDADLCFVKVSIKSGEYWNVSGMQKLRYVVNALKAYLGGTRPETIDNDESHGVAQLNTRY